MRLVDTGEIIFKDQIGGEGADLVSAFLADLNNIGKPQITIVLRNGQSNKFYYIDVRFSIIFLTCKFCSSLSIVNSFEPYLK